MYLVEGSLGGSLTSGRMHPLPLDGVVTTFAPTSSIALFRLLLSACMNDHTELAVFLISGNWVRDLSSGRRERG